MRLADKIKFDLMKSVRTNQSDLIIPNFYISSWYEMDVFKMTKSGYVTEFEIKISRADYFNDFKKGNDSSKSKHEKIKNGERICNYFTFVFPKGLIKKEEIPVYCGAMEYDNDKFNYLQIGKKLHKNKFTDYKLLCEKLTFRCNIIQDKYNWEKFVNEKKTKQYNEVIEILEKHNIEIP